MSHSYASEITFTVGPPGAGKTRWALSDVASRGMHRVQRVNLDDLMTMLQGRSFGEASSDDLKLAKRIMLSTIRSVAESGRDVIVDNTHLSTRFPNLVRDELGDRFQYRIRDFTGLDLQHVIAQDLARKTRNPPAYVGAEEVTRAWNKGIALRHRFGGEGLPLWESNLNQPDGIEPYDPDSASELPRAVIVDIDGTLLLARHRGPYDTSLYHTDELEDRLARLLSALSAATGPDPHQVIVLTGRYEQFREVLTESLERHGVQADEVYMRPDGDERRDNVVKLELFNKYIRDRFNVTTAFDDRDRVVRLWRRLGLFTCQVAPGDF